MMEPEEDLTLVDRIQRLPVEIREMVYSHLEINEVLRTRAVNKQFKELAAEQLSISKRLPRNYVEISMKPNDPRSLDAFKNECQNLDFKFLKIKIVHGVNLHDGNPIVNLEESQSRPEMNWFLKECAPYVKNLYVETLTLPIVSVEEVKFFDSFKDLESFSCGELTWIKSKKRISVPCCFKNLKHLNIIRLVSSGMGVTVASQRFRTWVTKIRATTTLEEFTCPDIIGRAAVAAFHIQLDLVMEVMKDAMDNNKPMRIDMNGLFNWAERVVPKRVGNQVAVLGSMVTPVLNLCAQAGFELEHVNQASRFLTHLDVARTLLKSMSLCGVSSLLRYDYLNLEKVSVLIDGDVHMDANAPQASYPKLRGADFYLLTSSASQVFCDRFFRNCVRPNLRSLSLEFDCAWDSPMLFTATDICNTCPNLTYLHLANFHGDDTSFLALWGRLPLLEYVSISGCPNITDTGLIGDAKYERIMDRGIRALKNLKFVELQNLQEITDKLFTTTLRHMNLKGLRVASAEGYGIDCYKHMNGAHSDLFKAWKLSERHEEVQTITLKGLRTLKTGVFAESIEMLDLNYLQIRGVSQDKVTELQGEFRSAKMIPA